MRRRIGAFVTSLAVVLAGAAGPDAPGWVSLFDGKTLDGWTREHSDHFHVRDGVIVIDGGTGWLRSARPYKDFELQAEYRALKKGADSGLLFRAGAECTPKPPHWPARGYQLQVIDAENNFMVFGHGTPAHFRRETEALRKVMTGAGEWQKVNLKVVGNRAEASLNGTPITVSEAINLPEGYIGLQGENGRFEWRALRIKEVSAR